MSLDVAQVIAEELSLRKAQVEATLALFAGGATVPFIARYRKEATANLDEVQIKAIEDRSAYLGELEARTSTRSASRASSPPSSRRGSPARARRPPSRTCTSPTSPSAAPAP
jgi:hypothetical protein